MGDKKKKLEEERKAFRKNFVKMFLAFARTLEEQGVCPGEKEYGMRVALFYVIAGMSDKYHGVSDFEILRNGEIVSRNLGNAMKGLPPYKPVTVKPPGLKKKNQDDSDDCL